MSVLGFFPGGGSGIKLQAIAITTPPAKTAYYVGDTFDPAGMVVTATYTNGAKMIATGYAVEPSTPLTLGATTITIRYTESGVSKTTTQAITVSKESVAVPTVSGSLTYTGSTQSPTWSGYNSAKMTISGTASAVNAGGYTATFALKDTARCQWADGTTAAKSVSWSIARAVISTVPSQNGSLTYTGSTRSPSWNNYDSGKMTLGGTTSSVNAGTFTATFTPGSNYRWSDGTTTAKNVSWTIAKAAGSLSISPTSMTLDTSNTSRTISVTRAGNGTITATSSDTSVATASVSGTTVTVRSVNNTSGSATITVKVAAGTNHTAPSSKTCSVTAMFGSLISQSWSSIKSISDAGNAANYWSIGDYKEIQINGSIGDFLTVNGTYRVFIIGFNHNSSREGSNRIHFQFGKLTSGTDVCFVDSQYWGWRENENDRCFNMNHTETEFPSPTGGFSSYIVNIGGWKSCDMRSDICGQSTSKSKTFFMALPSDLRTVIKSTNKYTDNTGGGKDVASYVTSTSDKIFLLSEFEVFGIHKFANSAEQNYQLQYEYYKNGNTVTKYRHDGIDFDVPASYWLRSPFREDDVSFCSVSMYDVEPDLSNSKYVLGIAPAFCV